MLLSARDYGYSCATRSLVYRGIEPCSGPALQKCLSCAPSVYGLGKGWAAVLGVAGGRALLRSKVDGIHSISTYVQQIVRRDFLDSDANTDASPAGKRESDSRGSEWPIEAIIPSFREDDEDTAYSADTTIQQYLEQLPDEPYILFVGALRRVKGVQQLLDAYEQLADAPPLVLIGTWESDSPDRLPPGVQVLPNLPHNAVMAAWEGALFGVIPSLWPEPLGSVVYEGMSRGKAMIGTTPGGHTDMIVDGGTGLLVPPGDVDALRAAMQTLLDDPDLCMRFGYAGRARARLFTAEVNVPRFEQLYRQLVDAKRTRQKPNDADAKHLVEPSVETVKWQSGA